MRKLQLPDDPFWQDTGTAKGLARMALAIRRDIMGGVSCPKELGAYYDRLLQNSVGASYVRKLADGSPASGKEDLHQVHSLLRWIESGLPIFDLTHGLMSALLLTDPSDVSADLIKPPFDTFVVRFPDGFWEMNVDSEPKTSASLGVIHSFDAESGETGKKRSMMSLRIVGRNGMTSTWEAKEPPSGDGSLAGWLDEDPPPVAGADDPSTDLTTPTEHDRRLIVAFRRLYANLCLYIAEHGRGEPLGKRDRGGSPVRGDRGEQQPDVWVLGREVKLDRDLMGAAKAWTDSKSARASAGEGWRLKERFTVRGHWRNQAHGPGRALRKMKWIAPFWKGQGPTFQHVYAPGESS